MTKIKNISNKQRERRLSKTIKEMKEQDGSEWLVVQYEVQLQVVRLDIAREEAKQEVFF